MKISELTFSPARLSSSVLFGPTQLVRFECRVGVLMDAFFPMGSNDPTFFPFSHDST